jgi:hypothetical protein
MEFEFYHVGFFFSLHLFLSYNVKFIQEKKRNCQCT